LHFFFDGPLSWELAASFLFRGADGVLLFWTAFGMMCNFSSDGVTTPPPLQPRPPTHLPQFANYLSAM
jgi:hypothetical protein